MRIRRNYISVLLETKLTISRNLDRDLHVVVNEFVGFVDSRRVRDADMAAEVRRLKAADDFRPAQLHQAVKTLLCYSDVAEWPLSCRLLSGTLLAAVASHYEHRASHRPFSDPVAGLQFDDSKDCLNGLREFVGRCFVEELFLLVKEGGVERVDIGDVDLPAVQAVAASCADFLLAAGFELYSAVDSHLRGDLNDVLKALICSADPEAKAAVTEKLPTDLVSRLCVEWVDSMVKRGLPPDGPPVQLAVRRPLRHRLAVWLKAGVILPPEEAAAVVVNFLLPVQAEQEIRDRLAQRNLSVAGVKGLKHDDGEGSKAVAVKADPGADEAFVTKFGPAITTVATGDLAVKAGSIVSVKAALCGWPRIRRFTRVEVAEHPEVARRFPGCRLDALAETHELQCDNMVYVKVANDTEEDVVIKPR